MLATCASRDVSQSIREGGELLRDCSCRVNREHGPPLGDRQASRQLEPSAAQRTHAMGNPRLMLGGQVGLEL